MSPKISELFVLLLTISAKTIAIAMVCFVVLCPLAKGVTEEEINCLKSIKESLQDPKAKLSSWDFTNTTGERICTSFVGVECWLSQDVLVDLDLSDMGLRGSFPRGIQHCGSLMNLKLSGNQLSGRIPYDLCEGVKYLTHLDLSNNSFSGEIPATITDCYYLNFLILNNNKLSGEIPEGIERMSRLKEFYVADNEGLCGWSLEPCKQEKEKEMNKENHSSIFMFGFMSGWVVSAVLFTATLLIFHTPIMLISNLADYLIFIFFKRKR